MSDALSSEWGDLGSTEKCALMDQRIATPRSPKLNEIDS